jgi:hypothetical protein
VTALPWVASQRASTDRSWPEPSWEMSPINASGHTLLVAWWLWRGSLPVGGTSCPPHRREWRSTAHGLGCSGLSLALLTAAWGNLFLSRSLSGGEVHHQDPLRLKRGLMPRRHMRLDRGSRLLTGELASPWHCLLLSSGLLSIGLLLVPFLMSVVLLEREVDIWPRRYHPGWNRHRGQSGRSFLHQWCGRDGSGRSPHVMPPGRGRSKPPSPLDAVRNSVAESAIMARSGDGVPL